MDCLFPAFDYGRTPDFFSAWQCPEMSRAELSEGEYGPSRGQLANEGAKRVLEGKHLVLDIFFRSLRP